MKEKQMHDFYGKIVCLGKNYLAHAEEMKDILKDVEKPLIFLKPVSSIVLEPNPVIYPAFSHEVHHEVELVVEIGKRGKRISKQNAEDFIRGYRIGIDLTARDYQREAKNNGWPWTIAKGFDSAGPLSILYLKERINGNIHDARIYLRLNEEIRQDASTRSMILGIEETIEYVSQYFTLEVGDLIFTGTPEGVSAIHPGDVITAGIDCLGEMTFRVNPESI